MDSDVRRCAGTSSDSDGNATFGVRRSKRATGGSCTKDYSLRTSSISARIESERKRRSPRLPKPKSKPPPLSKYRRRTANARERDRMRDMNEAFEALRGSVPEYPEDDGKSTKIVTLRLAVNYIKALRKMLGYTDADSEPSSDSSWMSQSSGSDAESCRSPAAYQSHMTFCSEFDDSMSVSPTVNIPEEDDVFLEAALGDIENVSLS